MSDAAAPTHAPPPAARPAALAPTLSFAWLNSLGTGAAMNGVYFITDARYGFTDLENLLLALLLGATYIAGALGAGAARRLAGRLGAGARGLLVADMLALAALCALPVLVDRPWAAWAFVAGYGPITGVLWPVIEGYVSGGRRGGSLRRAIGAFNLSWASAVMVAYWGMATSLEAAPLRIIAALGVVHLVCAIIAARLPREPAREVHEAPQPHPPVYEALLPAFRWLLALSFVLPAAITPILPGKMAALGLAIGWKTPLASAWMAGRLGMFLLMRRWEGWHGRWRTPVWATALMVGGFAMAVLAGAPWALVAGLALMGVGVGATYFGALYYAMEVGAAEVEAGGAHEALIGGGYSLGPLAGLMGIAVARITPIGPDEAMLLCVSAVAAAIIGAAARHGARAARRVRKKTTPDPHECKSGALR